MRVVVLGGFGNFGARICRALADHPAIEVVAAGRRPPPRQGSREVASRIQSAQLDIASPDFREALASLSPDLVIHCAGPFQGQDYRVVSSAMAARSNYIDLADGREFVAQFATGNDAEVRAAGLLAVSGASTLPALSSAVVDHLAAGFARLHEIQIVIAPAQRAPRGRATVAGVLSYAGAPFKSLKGGQWETSHGWQNMRRVRIEEIGERWAAACDVPDLELFPSRYPGVLTVEFRAALEVGIQHGGLWSVAMLRRAGLRLPVERWAEPLDRIASRLDGFGSERGGMLVKVTGTRADGKRASIAWHLVAPGNSGPEIPCIAAILLARKLACDEVRVSGAMPCMGLLALSEFESEFDRWGIQTTLQENVL